MVPPLPSCLEKTNNPNSKMHWCLRMKNVILRYGSSVNPEKWWILHPWQYSWPGEMGFWATWCSEWNPCPGRGVDLDDLSVSFQLKPFCDPVVLSALWGSWSTASGYNSHRAFPLLVVLLLLLLLLTTATAATAAITAASSWCSPGQWWMLQRAVPSSLFWSSLASAPPEIKVFQGSMFPLLSLNLCRQPGFPS